jgi:hypothetical protein
MRPNNSPFETADPFFRWLYERCGRSDILASLIILVVGALAFVGSIVFMGLLLSLYGQLTRQ